MMVPNGKSNGVSTEEGIRMDTTRVSYRLFLRSGTCVIVLILLTLSLHRGSVWAQADLETLTDQELLERLSEPGARELLERRFSTYSEADQRRIMREHFEAAAARGPATREEPSAAELIERLNTATGPEGWIKALAELELRYNAADAPEKRAIQTEYLAGWDLIPPPPAVPEHNDQFGGLNLYFIYANNAKKYFQIEEELLAALKSRLLRPEIPQGALHFLEALSQPGVAGVLGPLSAKYVDTVLTELETQARTPEFMEALPDIVQFSYSILGQCDRYGLDVIRKQGATDSEKGINALRYIDIPEAETMLWDAYESFPPTARNMRAKILGALMEKQKRAPNHERLERIRSEMVQYLKIPVGKFYLSELAYAAGVAGETRDPYYLPYLEEFKSAIASADLSAAVENSDYPEGFQSNLDALRAALTDAELRLIKAADSTR